MVPAPADPFLLLPEERAELEVVTSPSLPHRMVRKTPGGAGEVEATPRSLSGSGVALDRARAAPAGPRRRRRDGGPGPAAQGGQDRHPQEVIAHWCTTPGHDAARRRPLVGALDGQALGAVEDQGATDLDGPAPEATPGQDLQGVQRCRRAGAALQVMAKSGERVTSPAVARRA